jgi:hypothetical protein
METSMGLKEFVWFKGLFYNQKVAVVFRLCLEKMSCLVYGFLIHLFHPYKNYLRTLDTFHVTDHHVLTFTKGGSMSQLHLNTVIKVLWNISHGKIFSGGFFNSIHLVKSKKKKFEIHYRQSKYFKNNFSTEQTF